jgi:hypothetical protein
MVCVHSAGWRCCPAPIDESFLVLFFKKEQKESGYF